MPEDGGCAFSKAVGISVLVCDGPAVDLHACLSQAGVPPPNVLCIRGRASLCSLSVPCYHYHGSSGNVSVHTYTPDCPSAVYFSTLGTALLEVKTRLNPKQGCVAESPVVRIVIKDSMTPREAATALLLYGKPHMVVANGPTEAYDRVGVTQRWLEDWEAPVTSSVSRVITAEQGVVITHTEEVLGLPACCLIVMDCTAL